MGATRENNENLLAVDWWVILKLPDLFFFWLQGLIVKTLQEI